MPADKQQRVFEILRQMPTAGLAAARRLFSGELGYRPADEPLLLPDSPGPLSEFLLGAPILLASHESPEGSFDVIYCRLLPAPGHLASPLSLVAERSVVGRLLPEHPFALFIFSDPGERTWHLVNVPHYPGPARRRLHRRIVIGPHHCLRTASLRVALLDLAAPDRDQAHLSPSQIQQRHDDAFDVEALAKQFFQDFYDLFRLLKSDLLQGTGDAGWAHESALQFLGQQMSQRFLQLFPTSVRVGPLRNLTLSRGFFTRKDLAQPYRARLTGARLQQVLEFLGGYTYTATEDTPLDQEVAVGPSTIGKVFESLVDLSEGSTQRGEVGIYYSPRVEIDLMCRLALVDWLANHLGPKQKPLLYKAVFAVESEHRGTADAALAELNLWPGVRRLLRSVTVVDPACGSGSFLVGMLSVLDNLCARANAQLGVAETAFERKRHIVAHCLYGVDVLAWAVEITRLRLWLQLLAAGPGTSADLVPDSYLPGVDLNLHCGDSLVPDTGEIHLAAPEDGQPDPSQADTIPFAWDVAFAEVFERRRPGFDIVVGNPPYVRQELIHDPRQPSGGGTVADRVAYKAKLARAVYAAWPRTFGYEGDRDRARWKLDARSDLYIYFYLHGLSLLNGQGTFCFITSNSWLDVRYGRDLQEFLLTRGKLKLVIENQARRSFSGVDVNTVITLLGPAQDATTPCPSSLQHQARFLLLSIPFDQALDPAIWLAVEGAASRDTTPEYRVHPLKQVALLDHGLDPHQKRFVGEKWGAKYLRAPDIYWLIVEKAGAKLLRLGSVAQVRRGITTGANGFFFLDEQRAAQWAIEKEFLAPAVRSPRDCSRIWLEPSEGLGWYIFVCHKERDELQGTRALEYIKYGEAQGLDQRPTLRGRARWWDLGPRSGAHVHCNYLVDRVMRFYASASRFLTSDNFQEIRTSVEPQAMAAACNSTICQLSANVLGRSNFGGGLLKLQTFEVKDLWIPDPTLLGEQARRLTKHAGLLHLDDPQRHALDSMVFDMLGLTTGERDAVYEAVQGLVSARLSKARNRASPD
jgi:hypothetical protein